METGREATEVDMAPINLGAEEVESVSLFPYLGSTIQSSGRAEVDVGRRLAQASKAFGALHKAVFGNKDLTLKIKHTIYQACVLPVLLYGSECWIPLRRDLRRLNTFHHRCVRTVLASPKASSEPNTSPPGN